MRMSRLMMPRPAMMAGAVSAVLMMLIHQGFLTGVFVVPILPLAPLAWAGFRFGVAGLSAATFLSLVGCVVLLGPVESFLMLMLQLFPAWLFFRELLKLRLYADGQMQWQPPGGAFVAVTLYASLTLALQSLLAPEEFHQLLASLAENWQAALARLEPSSAQALQGIDQISHLALAFAVWMAGAMFYAAACLGNVVVLAYQRSVRPSLALEPFMPPVWLFVMFLLAGTLALLGSKPAAMVGQMLSLILLLPYFISGLSHVHRALRRWQYPALWISGFYILILMTLWPVLFLAAYGLMRQCVELISPVPAPR
jgi:hypothetical protein